MNDLLEQLAADPWGRLVLQSLASGGIRQFFLFLMVTSRLTGAIVVAPYGMANVIPISVRVSLVLMLSLIIAPTLNSSDEMSRNVIPTNWDTRSMNVAKNSPTDLGCLVASELGLGALLGTGVIAVMSGLRLAGEWLDRHSGLGLGSVFNPDWSPGDPACTSLVSFLGIAAFLAIEPVGGQWLLLRSFADSFHVIPMGSATCSTASIELLGGIAQQSLILGLRIAMPLVVTMIIVDLTLALISRSAPSSLSSSWFAVRVGVGMIVLSVTLTSIPEVIAFTTMSIIQSLVDVR